MTGGSGARKAVATAAVVFCAAGGLLAQPPANDCSDLYWQDSLRCVVAGAEPPQPPPTPPSAPNQIKEYTRVDLEADLGIRCLDGTRPILYVDPAVGGAADKWIISFTGGGSCAAEDLDGDGTYDGGEACADPYFGGEAGEMGTAGEPAMRNFVGILRPDPAINPIFAGFHRVRVEKCSYDRYNGRATHPELSALLPNSDPFTYTLYQHGRKIVRSALDALRGDAGTGEGLTYTTWVDVGGTVEEQIVTLPALENASFVLLIGHSGGAHGLMHNADFFADHLRSWPQFSGDVRAVLDANYLPSIENETAFDPGGAGDLYDHVWAGSTPDVGTYDGAAYYTDSFYVEQYDAWLEHPDDSLATLLDASCVGVHEPQGEEWMCRDRYHVLFNHMTTPFFAREDFSDPNVQHTWDGMGHLVSWANWAVFPHCALLGISPCPPLLPAGNPSPYRDRHEQQYATILADLDSRSELALGEDPSGPPPSFALWMPDCGSHGGAYTDKHFFGVQVQEGTTSWTMRELLESFLQAPPTGAAAAEIDGLAGRISICTVPIFEDGFESGDTAAWSTTVP